MTNYGAIREEGVMDDIGTVRVSDEFGTIAVYVKVDENSWQTIYIDPARINFLVATRMMSDTVAARFPVVYAPKTVV